MIFFKRNKFYKIIIAVFLLLVFLNFINFSSFGRRIFSIVVEPGTSYSKNLSEKLFVNKKNKKELEDKILILEEKIQSTDVEMARLYSLEDENNSLRNHLSFFNDKSFDYVLANVLWQENFLNFSHYNQNIIINKGSDNNLRPGLAVLNEFGIVVGRIIDVQEKQSRVCLMNNNFCKMAVSVNNNDRSIGLAEGNLGLSIKLNFVPQNEVINIGDMIISSGLESDVPRGLAVGKVNYINQDVSDIWQNISIEPLFNTNKLGIVSIIIPK